MIGSAKSGGRTRTFGSLKPGMDFIEYHSPLSCSNRIEHVNYTYGNPPQVGETLYMVDVVTPHFRRRSSLGEVILNPMFSRRKSILQYGSTNFTLTTVADACSGPSVKGTYRETGAFLYFKVGLPPDNVGLISDSEKSRLIALATTKALANRRKAQTNLWESIAEIDKLFHMFLHPFENLARFVRDFPKGSKRGKLRKTIVRGKVTYEFVASEWLRFRYGITPFLSDLQGLVKAFEKGYPKKTILITSRDKRTSDRSSSQTTTTTSGPVDYSWQRTSRHKYEVRVACFDYWQPSLTTELGLTLPNFVGLFWELTHFSFVVDWFVNLGDYIYANIPQPDIEPKGMTISTREESTCVFSPVSVVLNASGSTTFSSLSGSMGDSISCSVITKNRDVGTVDPSVAIEADFRFDRFKRVADAAALIPALLGKFSFLDRRKPFAERDLSSNQFLDP